MKTNLERAFKKSLENYEAPYNAEAWKALNAKMGTSASTGMSLVAKWGIAAVTTAVLSVAVYFLFFDQQTNPKNQKIAQTAVETTDRNVETVPAEKNTSTVDHENTHQKVMGQSTVIEHNNRSSQSTTTPVDEEKQNNPLSQDGVYNGNDSPTKAVEHNNIEKQSASTTVLPIRTNSTKYIAGTVSTKSVCAGDKITVVNNGSKGEFVRFPLNYKWITLAVGEKYSFPVNTDFEIDFFGENIPSIFINVYELPSANFTYTANVFHNGLPVVDCEAYGNEGTYEWSFDNKTSKEGENVTHNFFKQGEHTIQLTVTDRNGCKQIKTKKIHIKNNYNLLAVDAFKPNGSDSRNITFMPYALKERGVKFKLTIIDPTDNGIVFTSKSTINAWNGVDQRTGEMTPANKVYIWSVKIFNPQPNERPVYSGTVVHN